MQKNVVVVIPNWNGARELPAAIDSILSQTLKKLELIVVDNGSTDRSKTVIQSYAQKDKRIRGIYRDKNCGYTGGVNPGMEAAIRQEAEFVATINNDAIASKDWLKHLVDFLQANSEYGIATGAILNADGKTIDSVGEQYSSWGLPYPRGRGRPFRAKSFISPIDTFGASGGASIYRISMLKQVGVFDQDFFAYYEDVDLSFRAQLAGWKVAFVPNAVVYHERGNTSARIAKRKAGDHSTTPFLTKQFMKNVPFVLVKNMPAGLIWRVLPRFCLSYMLLFGQAVVSGRGGGALKGALLFWLRLPKKLLQRYKIQRTRRVSNRYIWGLLVKDLPPDAYKLRKLRSLWRRAD